MQLETERLGKTARPAVHVPRCGGGTLSVGKQHVARHVDLRQRKSRRVTTETVLPVQEVVREALAVPT